MPIMHERRVVVTGLGVAAPIGLGISAFWEGLLDRRCGVRRIDGFDPSGLACRVAGVLPPIVLRDYIPKTYRKSAKVMSRDIVVAVVCAHMAVTDGGLRTTSIIERGEAEGPPNVDTTRFGANIGAGLIPADLDELAGALVTAAENGRFSLSKWGRDGMRNLTPLWLLKFLPNMLACHVTIVHDAQAPSNTITCGEASSHLAIGEAFRTIARGDADVCICGGAESLVCPMGLVRSQLIGRLNTQCNDTPERALRPFGKRRAGCVVADGGGLVILEALDHALARGVRVYAEVIGFGAGTNAHSWSQPDPQGRGIETALRTALADACTDASHIDMVTTVGVGTQAHDAAEATGWGRVFGDRLPHIPAVAIRGGIGDCGAGGGALDFATTVMALYHRTVPPSLNTDDLDPACTLRFATRRPMDADLRQAVTLGCAMAGGQNAAIVVRRYESS